MGSHRARRSRARLSRAPTGRPDAPGSVPRYANDGYPGDGYADGQYADGQYADDGYPDDWYAVERTRSPARPGISQGRSPGRRPKLIILVTSVVLAVAAVVLFAASAAARRQPSTPHRTSVTTTSRSVGAGHGHAARHGLTAVSPGIGLRGGALSPNAPGYSMAEAAIAKLTPLQLAGQRVIYSYRGLNPPARLLWLIEHGEVAGVIFFSDNVGSPAHLAAVARELQHAALTSPHNPVREPLLLMTDQEGGLVRRLPGPPALSEKQVGQSSHPQAAARAAGAGAGANLRAAGLNVNLAPVLDVYRAAGNFIDEYGRSFSNRPGTVAKLGALYAAAEQAKGVAATVKHFPGLGAAARSQNTDERPVTLNVPLHQLRTVDESPYKSAIAVKAKLVMVSWAIYPALDRTYPAGLSRKIVHGELRQRLGFAGVTITDALEAGALRPFGSISRRATLAARAGMDLLLCAQQNYREGDTAMRALDSYYAAASPSAKAAFKAAAERVIALRATLVGG